MWGRLTRLRRAAIGDDSTGPTWKRLTPQGRDVIRLAYVEARELGHPCLADEHVVLGVLRHGTSQAAALLRSRGLDLLTARAELLRVGPTLGPRPDPVGALRDLGIDVEQVRERLEATFGAHAVRAAERRVRRRPRWRGGHPRPTPFCVYLLAKRSLEFAARSADRHGDRGIGPEHLLYGALHDARDPLGTQLNRRTRRQLQALGWTPGRPNPVRLMLEARHIDLSRLTAELGYAGPTHSVNAANQISEKTQINERLAHRWVPTSARVQACGPGQRQHRNQPCGRHEIRIVEHRRGHPASVRKLHLRDALPVGEEFDARRRIFPVRKGILALRRTQHAMITGGSRLDRPREAAHSGAQITPLRGTSPCPGITLSQPIAAWHRN